MYNSRSLLVLHFLMPKRVPGLKPPWRPGPELDAVLHRLADGDPSLTAIRLHSNIGDLGVKMLSAMLHASSPELQAVYLSGNDITCVGAALFADALRENDSLTKVHLSRNAIADDGACALAEALASNSTLKELILYENDIGDKGVLALANMLKANTALERLSLAGNPTTADGWEHFVDVMEDPRVVLSWALRELDGVDLVEHHEQLKLPEELAALDGGRMPANLRARAIIEGRQNAQCLAFLKTEAKARVAVIEAEEKKAEKAAAAEWE